uniref:Uncharacterized protein n=1 Tax=Arundo donax TaxID=35708 RepID=A0A0A9FXG0_ARUDO
MCQMHKLFIL